MPSFIGVPQRKSASDDSSVSSDSSSDSSAGVYIPQKTKADLKGVGSEWKNVPNSEFKLEKHQFGGSFEWLLASKDGKESKEMKGKEEEFKGV